MRKALSLLICLIILFNISGYYFMFSIMRYQARKEMKAFIKSQLKEEEMEKITITDYDLSSPASSIKFVKKNEFIHKGKLYDIVRRKKEGETTTFLCINDKTEEKLFSNLDEQIKRNTESAPLSKSRSAHILKCIIKQAIIEHHQILNNPSEKYFTFHDLNERTLKQYLLVYTPPPEA